MKRLLPLALLLCALPASATNWYVAENGGTRYKSSTVPFGQCNGQSATAYPGTTTDTWTPGKSVSLGYTIADNNGHYETVTTAGTTNGSQTSYTYPTWGMSTVTDGTVVWTQGATYPVNQSCPYMQFWMLWSANDNAASSWVIAGGDTVIVSGCKPLGTEMNSDAPHCRLGYQNNYGGNYPNWACGSGNPNISCYNPTIPAGTSGAHTRFLSACAAISACQTGGLTNPKLYDGTLTQLYGGFGLYNALNFQSTQYVDFEGFEVTTHNGICSTVGGSASLGFCSASPPYSDFALHGIVTDNTTANITLQDDYIHGFNSAGVFGPIGGPFTYMRTFVGFNASAGTNFDDGSDTPDGAGSSLIFHHTIFEGNGCQEEYPIVDTFPSARCWDDVSNGFGDAISGQDTELDSLSADDYQAILNTKDGFIGPHTAITTMTVVNSASLYNMGQQWKWGGGSVPQTVTFESNLTLSGCGRMSAPLNYMGLVAPTGYNTYLSDFCRAAGNVIASDISTGSTWTIANNTFVFNTPTLLDVACSLGFSHCTGSNINWFNNGVLGYINIPTGGCCGGDAPAIFFNEVPSDITITPSHNGEYGSRNGSCPSTGSPVCTDPLFLNEPAQSVTAQSALDVFTTTSGTSSFYPTGSSPLINAGTTGGPGTDYFGMTQTSPATIGAVVYATTPTAATPTFSPPAGTVSNPTVVTASTSTSGCGSYIYFDTNPTPVTNQTTYTVTTAVTLYAYVHSCPGYLDSAVGSAAYTITSPSGTTVGSGVTFGGSVTIQ